MKKDTFSYGKAHTESVYRSFGLVIYQMSRVMREPTLWFPTWSDTNQAVQSQKMDRSLKFRIWKVEGLYYIYIYSENKGADQLSVTAKLICVYVFAYAKRWFAHDAAQIMN